MVGHGTGLAADVRGASGGFGSGHGSGLNPNRVRGFGVQQAVGGRGGGRLETPTLNEMKAKQGAIVAKFMTFFRRKNTLVIEMYEQSFYKQKPTWDKIADFVYKDLCQTPEMRKEIKDVQFHPVKMLLFIRFSEDVFRDEVVAKIQSPAGLVWSDYRVRVKGYSLDAQVKFIRLLGVSPETGEDEIKRSFTEAGIGEVIQIKKGLLDDNRLPGVTNGTWELRVKFHDPEKVIPSYIHRRDEGELWSLNFEGRVFCCWKCGSGTHIGDKCRDQARTFDEMFNESDDSSEVFVKPTWAAVVRSGNGDTEEHKRRVQVMEKKLKEENQRKERARVELEEKRRLEELEKDKKRFEKEKDRRKVLEEVAVRAAEAAEAANVAAKATTAEQPRRDLLDGGHASDAELLEAVEGGELQVLVHPQLRSMGVAVQHNAWLQSREKKPPEEFPLTVTVHPELQRILGIGATRLAIEYEGWDGNHSGVDDDWGFEDVVQDDLTSSPMGQRPRGIKRGKADGGVASASDEMEVDNVGSDNEDSDADNMALGSSCITSGTESDEEENDNKKPRLDDSKEASNQSLDLVESDRQDVTDIPSVAGVTRTVLRATRKEDKGRSSGVAGAITSEKSSKGEEGQE